MPVLIHFLNILIHSTKMSQAPRKQEKDFTAEVKALQPEVEETAKVRYSYLREVGADRLEW